MGGAFGTSIVEPAVVETGALGIAAAVVGFGELQRRGRARSFCVDRAVMPARILQAPHALDGQREPAPHVAPLCVLAHVDPRAVRFERFAGGLRDDALATLAGSVGALETLDRVVNEMGSALGLHHCLGHGSMTG